MAMANGRHEVPARPAWLWLWLGLALIVLVDQLTKTLIIGHFQLRRQPRRVTASSTSCACTTPARRSRFLAGGRGLAALVLRRRWASPRRCFIVWMLRAHPDQKLFCFAVSLILGGALGNVIDRLLHGYVVDFLDFHFGSWSRCSRLATSRPSTWPTAPSRWVPRCLILDELLRVRRA